MEKLTLIKFETKFFFRLYIETREQFRLKGLARWALEHGRKT